MLSERNIVLLMDNEIEMYSIALLKSGFDYNE